MFSNKKTATAQNRITVADGMTVGRIGYGSMKLTGPQVWGEYPDHAEAVAMLRGVVEAGVDFIDTADVYGPHYNEELIREALHPYPEGLRIATKGGFVRGGPDYSTLGAVGNVNYLRQAAHMSAKRLGVSAIDLYYLHSGTATDAPFEDQVGALAELQRQGLIRHVGLSNVTLDQLRIAQGIVEVAAVTAVYNVTVRVGADLLRAAEQDGIAFSPWHPVTLTDIPERAEHAREVLGPIAGRHAATTQQIALAWLLQRSPVTLPIPGTTSPAHLKENLEARSLTLSDDEMAAITAISPES
jgi:pyridoxine 4-dehydrogenase